MNEQETTATRAQRATPAPKPPRRGLSFKTFCTLDGITPEIVNDMHRCLRGDGYDRVNRTTRAFMRRHNLDWVVFYGSDVNIEELRR